MSIILVVDDESDARNMAADAIKRMGHIVIMSPNGKHAYELLETNEDIDLLITDILMPEMDGQELIRKVRANSKLAKMPIIAISGYIGPKDISSILEVGADIFMGKPYEISEFRGNITKYLER